MIAMEVLKHCTEKLECYKILIKNWNDTNVFGWPRVFDPDFMWSF